MVQNKHVMFFSFCGQAVRQIGRHRPSWCLLSRNNKLSHTLDHGVPGAQTEIPSAGVVLTLIEVKERNIGGVSRCLVMSRIFAVEVPGNKCTAAYVSTVVTRVERHLTTNNKIKNNYANSNYNQILFYFYYSINICNNTDIVQMFYLPK